MIAVIGAYGVGMTMRVRHAPQPGETITGGVLSVGPGGKGSNQAIAVARLGHEVQLATVIGDDSAGAEAHALWLRESVDSSAVSVVSDASTMTGFIVVDAAGENRIAIAPGALERMTAAHAEAFRGSIRTADLLVVSLEIPWAVAERALRIAGEEGTRRLLNPAPANVSVDLLRSLTDIVTPNETEARVLLGLTDGDPRDDESLALDLATAARCAVVMTLGARGAVVVEAGVVSRIAPVAAPKVVDTTGAGDAFTAALAVALVEGSSLVEAARWAVRAGAHAVGIPEVIPALPYRQDMAERHEKEHATR